MQLPRCPHRAARAGPDSIVTTVFSDDNKKYLSTGLLQTEPVKEHYLSPDVTLESLRVIPALRPDGPG